MDKPLKRCSKCGAEKPPTPEYFAKDKRASDGLRSACKVCQSVDRDSYDARYPDRANQSLINWKLRNPDKVAADKKDYDARHPDKARARAIRANEKRKLTGRTRDPVKEAAYQSIWKARNPLKVKSSRHKREAVKIGLPSSFTELDWKHALDYWHGHCAVCGRLPDDNVQLAPDHWIPLSASTCPGTVPNNIIPLCHSKKAGALGCNNRKRERLPIEWLNRQFGETRANEILSEIQAYFDSLK